ncbi:MAG: glycosyltransferase [Legionellaceae bacterium]|nr:glycosyltransferase [Legionellaceae bacterium]
MRIAHVITGLGNGGAEGVLYRLVTNDSAHTHCVISLQDLAVYGTRLSEKGIELYTLDMPRGGITLKGMRKLFRIIRAFHPDVVQTWMYHADLLGGLAARFAGVKAVVWSIRGAYNKDRTTLKTKMIIYICIYLSRWVPQFVISNSKQAGDTHVCLGYKPQKMKVVHNGFSFLQFQSDTGARDKINTALGLTPNVPLLGMVARYDIYKDHPNLFRALAYLLEASPPFICLLIGPGMDVNNEALMVQLHAHGIQDNVRLLGARDDIPSLMAALDIHVLSSAGESFPNVIAEAMACGTPCVTTAVGDAPLIVGETGWLVPPSDGKALALALQEAMTQLEDKESWAVRKQTCIERVHSKFGLSCMLDAYDKVWVEAFAQAN